MTGTDVRTPLLAALIRPYPNHGTAPAVSRPATRPAHFADAGMTILRGPEEIWCRCDGGPHGFLSIAAHAHADALSVEVRHDGVDVLADPGTFCYHGQPEWRQYFRSTLGHNTLQLDGGDQSVSGGPFLWTRHARSRVLATDTSDASGTGVVRWSAEHDGYQRSVHRRRVELTAESRELRVVDEVGGPGGDVRLAFHLGPAIAADLVGNRAVLTWIRDGEGRSAVLELPGQLSWQAHRGESDPPLGWYSAGFGRKEPTTTLVGTGFADGTALSGSSPPCSGSTVRGRVGNKRRHRALAVAPLALALLVATGCESTPGAKTEPKAATPTSAASAVRAVAKVCAKPTAGPAKAPEGAVTVDPAVVGDLAAKTKSSPRTPRSGCDRASTGSTRTATPRSFPRRGTATSVRRARCSTAGRRTSTRSRVPPATSPSAT